MRKSIGWVDSELGLDNITTSLRNISAALSDLAGKFNLFGDGLENVSLNFTIQEDKTLEGIKMQERQRQYIEKTYKTYLKYYEKIQKMAKESYGIDEGAIYALSNSRVAEIYGNDFEAIRGQFGYESITNPAGDRIEQISKIQRFIELMKQAAKEATPGMDAFWDSVAGMKVGRKLDMSTINSALADITEIKDKTESMTQKQNAIQELFNVGNSATDLSEIKVLLEDIALILKNDVAIGSDKVKEDLKEIMAVATSATSEIRAEITAISQLMSASANAESIADNKQIGEVAEETTKSILDLKEAESLNISTNETEAISALLPVLTEVIAKVGEKTNAFREEEVEVERIAKSETLSLSAVSKVLDDITLKIKEINANGLKIDIATGDLGNLTATVSAMNEITAKASTSKKSGDRAEDYGYLKAEAEALKYTNSLYSEQEKNLSRIFKLKTANLNLGDSFSDQEKNRQNLAEILTLEKRNAEIKKVLSESDAELISREEKLVKLQEELNRQYSNSSMAKEAAARDTVIKNAESFQKQVKELLKGGFGEKTNAELTNISATIESFANKARDVSVPVEELENEFKVLEGTIDEISEKTIPKMKTASAATVETMKLKIEEFIRKNPKMGESFIAEFRRLQDSIDLSSTVQDIANAKAEFSKLEAQINRLGKTGPRSLDILAKRIKQMSINFVAMYFSFYDMIRYGRQVVDTVTDIDTALTELRKVSDATDDRLSKSFENSAKTAKELGATIDDVINMTADWSRLGYSVDQAEDLARATTLMKNVSENISAEDASSYLISTLQGFNIEAENAVEIIDKYNNVANHMPISTAGIGQALQRSAASFKAANTDLSESIALVTTANAVLQNPEMVGKSLPTCIVICR